MNFSDAMECLKKGSKVTRKLWDKKIYFFLKKNEIKCYQSNLSHYAYNQEIMISDGWIVDDIENQEYQFCDIIPLLRLGSKARLKVWSNRYIYYDFSEKELISHSMSTTPFIPGFEAFSADDWIELK